MVAQETASEAPAGVKCSVSSTAGLPRSQDVSPAAARWDLCRSHSGKSKGLKLEDLRPMGTFERTYAKCPAVPAPVLGMGGWGNGC